MWPTAARSRTARWRRARRSRSRLTGKTGRRWNRERRFGAIPYISSCRKDIIWRSPGRLRRRRRQNVPVQRRTDAGVGLRCPRPSCGRGIGGAVCAVREIAGGARFYRLCQGGGAAVDVFGDSITQGVRTALDGYEYWVARIAEGLGARYGVWNLGSGWARAYDAAADGAWLGKVKHGQGEHPGSQVILALGVNDIDIGARTAEQLLGDLETIISLLKKTIPPRKSFCSPYRRLISADRASRCGGASTPRFGPPPSREWTGCSIWRRCCPRRLLWNIG